MTLPAANSQVASTLVEIQPVLTGRQRAAFLEFPWDIYQGDPLWRPPLLAERREFIDPRRHPFFLHGEAACFLAVRNGKGVGRILVSVDPRYNDAHGTRAGCFGMYESIDDQAVAQALLDAAASWLRSRGMNELLGPIDYSTNYQCGLLVDGFDTPPRVFMNHNPEYYARLFAGWGLTKAKDLYAWWFADQSNLAKRWSRLAGHLARRNQITIRPFNLKDARNEILRCKSIYNEAWTDNWGFVRMSDEEFMFFARDLLKFVPPDLLLMAEIDGRVVGLSMTLPDFNQAFLPLNGRIFRYGLPLGYFRFKRELRKVDACRLIALGVLEPYRRRGVAELLILEALRVGTKLHNYSGAELGWTLEDNDLINHAIEKSGAERYKTYRIFRREI